MSFTLHLFEFVFPLPPLFKFTLILDSVCRNVTSHWNWFGVHFEICFNSYSVLHNLRLFIDVWPYVQDDSGLLGFISFVIFVCRFELHVDPLFYYIQVLEYAPNCDPLCNKVSCHFALFRLIRKISIRIPSCCLYVLAFPVWPVVQLSLVRGIQTF